jgi:hypothetical protein
MKKEIDLLQIETAKPAVPWHKQMPVLISIAALVLSLLTTYYAERRSAQQDLHNARVELRQLIFQIDENSLAAVDIDTRYKNNPSAQVTARSLALTRRIILVNQAADVIDEIRDRVTSAEYYTIGYDISTLGIDDPRVINYYQRGLKRPGDVNTKAALYRGLAQAYFGTRRIEEGRKAFEEALSVSSHAPSGGLSNEAYTQYQWAVAELNAGNCVNARRHLGAAEDAYDSFTNGGGFIPTGMQEQLKASKRSLESRC